MCPPRSRIRPRFSSARFPTIWFRSTWFFTTALDATPTRRTLRLVRLRKDSRDSFDSADDPIYSRHDYKTRRAEGGNGDRCVCACWPRPDSAGRSAAAKNEGQLRRPSRRVRLSRARVWRSEAVSVFFGPYLHTRNCVGGRAEAAPVVASPRSGR